MSIWELPKEHYNWESPITKIYGDIHNEIVRQDEENYMYTITQAVGYKIDKEELLKALRYDREQYNKGYKDGVRETFIEELKKIKEEIKLNACGEYDFEGYCREEKISIKEVNKIIDKHITELKGE